VRAAAPAFLVDAAFVVLFATLGRISHTEGVSWAGVLGVAGPFLVALATGWALARWRTGWPTRPQGSTPVWLVTVVLGLALRVATGGGFAWSFGLVTLVMLGLFLIGWRCAVEVVRFAMDSLARWSANLARRSR
jgi:Protein of unknown function (DUF3054)